MDAVAGLTTQHVLQTRAIVDAQGAKDWKAAYADVWTAYAHMQMIGDALVPAIATKSPDKFAGDPSNKGVGLRVALNQLLQEHLYLASSATGAALDGRDDEFATAGDVLNTNGTDLGAAIGSLYGPELATRSTRSGARTTASSPTTPSVWRRRTKPCRTRRSAT